MTEANKDQEFNDMISAAIVASLGEEQRKVIFERAMTYLSTVKPRESFMDKTKTPLQSAFDTVISEVCQQTVREVVQSNQEFQGKVRELITAAMSAALTKNTVEWLDLKEQLSRSMAEYLSNNWD